jgi:endonuclease/exonuclease/phosphatase family metal-dependent hydrolase
MYLKYFLDEKIEEGNVGRGCGNNGSAINVGFSNRHVKSPVSSAERYRTRNLLLACSILETFGALLVVVFLHHGVFSDSR